MYRTSIGVLFWLDGNTNQLAAPNENYGREFMELFTLGKDRYTQEDVRQAARAFTGYTVDNQGTVTFRPALHDAGEKVILGNRGNFGPLDVADIVLDRHPEGAVAASYVAQRLAVSLYRPDPEPEVVAAMADAFAGSGFEIKPMVRALLTRPEFSDGPGVTIKAPAEFVAGAMRALDLVATPMIQGRFRELDELAAFCAYMGQELYNPPTVFWTNLDAVSHDVAFDSIEFSAYLKSPGDTAQLSFPTPGHFTYRCNQHPEFPGMQGLVFVSDSAP